MDNAHPQLETRLESVYDSFRRKVIRKLLAHIVGVFHNYCLGQQLLQFEVSVQV
jgi:hypothetical protein